MFCMGFQGNLIHLIHRLNAGVDGMRWEIVLMGLVLAAALISVGGQIWRLFT